MHTLKTLETFLQIASFATQDTATLVKLASGKELVPYIGLVGHNNLGDDILFDAHKVLFPSFNLVPYRKNGAILDKMARRFKRSFTKHAILGGGTLINDGVIWISKVEQLLQSGRRMFCLGTGAEASEFYGEDDASSGLLKRWVNALAHFEFVGVRGPRSKVILERAGAKNVVITGDTALALTQDHMPARQLTGTVGLTYGATKGNPMWGDTAIYRGEIVRVIKMLIKHGYDVKLMPIWNVDIPSNMSVMREIDSPNCTMVKAYDSLAHFSSEVQTCDFFIGQKLHSTIIALMNRVPSIMVEYRPKCRDFMASIELEDYVIKTSDFTEQTFWPLFERLRAESKRVCAQAEERILLYKRLQFAEAQKLEASLIAA
jgi:hypothetical protein